MKSSSQRFTTAPSSTKRPNRHPFAAEKLLLSTSKEYNLKHHHHQIMKQSQRKRSRIALLFALLSILSTLLVLANLFLAPGNTSYTIEETFTIHNRGRHSKPLQDKRKQRTRQYNRSEDQYHRQIKVVEYKDVFSVGTDHNNNDTTSQAKANAKASSEWSPKQLQEMEKYYQRYLEVFHQKHGYDYEPEPKEVVYREYLAYRERKMKELQERKQKQAMEQNQQEAAMRKRATELRQQQTFEKSLSLSTPSKTKESSRKNETDRNNNNNNNNDGNHHPIETPHRVVADQIMVKPAPYTLELEMADMEPQATHDRNVGSLSHYRNYTATIVTGGATPATTISIR